jgi:outer membrane receptor protein involved in Fe transport
VVLTNVATQVEQATSTDASGRYQFGEVSVGIYRVRVEKEGFSTAARNLTLAEPGERLEANFDVAPGGLSEQVTVTAARGERDTLEIPVRTETVDQEELLKQNLTTTQDSLTYAPNVTPVGNGPFQQRPKLRGLDSTRILILVDGERLNTSRVATTRAGPEIGLIDPSLIQSVEVISGSGSVLYGTDALSGTINLITDQPQRVDQGIRAGGTLNLFYSTNEKGRRGNARFDVSGHKFALRFSGELERFENYHAGEPFNETNVPFINRVTTFSDTPAAAFQSPPGLVTLKVFGGVFPDNFNAPFTRTSSEVPNSQAHGSDVHVVARFFPGEQDGLRVSWIRRRNSNIGFADNIPPFLFQTITSPFSNLDKYSARYERRGITPWFTGLAVSAYHQQQDRKLLNLIPGYGISLSSSGRSDTITRADVLSDTRQTVKSYGYDVQTNFLIEGRNILTAGTSFFRDHSRDSRLSRTRITLVGSALRPPAPPTFIPIGVQIADTGNTFPQRVPTSNFDNFGFFLQDELNVNRWLRLIGGLRVDRFRVETFPTPGYNPLTGITGANPPIDTSKLPSATGQSFTRTTVTGDVGVVVRPTQSLSLTARVGRSLRHPNLEELLFSGPATVGNLIPNIKLEPETGINVDVGTKVRTSRYAAGFSYFNNTFHDFIDAQIVSITPTAPIYQSLNFARVRIQGFEGDFEVPLAARSTAFIPFGSIGYVRGTVLEAIDPLTKASLNRTPLDKISPLKAVVGFRWQDKINRWWSEYNVRAQAKVDRLAPTFINSPFLSAQNLFQVRGFSVHTLRGGYNFQRERGRIALTLAVENLANKFYREQFQYAPARGRTFTVGLLFKYF